MRDVGLDARVAVRALVVGALACSLALAAHLAHGASPSPASIVLGATIGSLIALPFSFGRPSSAMAIIAVAAGQLALHVWFAWTAFPAASAMPGMTMGEDHAMHATGTVLASSALDLLPSPTMLACHLGAAVVCAVTLLRCDRIISAVIHVLERIVFAPTRLTVVSIASITQRIPDDHRPLCTEGVTRQPCVRRGPPAPIGV